MTLCGTSGGALARLDSGGGELPAAEVELEVTKEAPRGFRGGTERVWLHPGGGVGLAQAVGGGVYWVDVPSLRARPLVKFYKAAPGGATAAGWLPPAAGGGTCRAIIGTAAGELWEVALERPKSRERPPARTYVLPFAEPVTGVTVEVLEPRGGGGKGSGLVCIVTTPSRFYTFCGPGLNLAAIFETYSRDPDLQSFIELPGEGQSSGGDLVIFRGPDGRAERFAWLASPGVYHGSLVLKWDSAPEPGMEHVLVPEHTLLPFTEEDGFAAGDVVGVSLTEHHVVLVGRGDVRIINRVSECVVFEEGLKGKAFVGAATDAASGAIFAFTECDMYEVILEDEGAGMWQLHLDREEFQTAHSFCSTSEQHDYVYNRQADLQFEAGNFLVAAGLYGKIKSSHPSFESIALKFTGAGSPEATRKFLMEKLRGVSEEMPAQAAMLSIWLTELLLDNVNQAILRHGEGSEENMEATAELRKFIEANLDKLDEGTTFQLLGSYGLVEEIIHFAELVGDTATIVQHLLVQKQYERVLRCLAEKDAPAELWYEYAPPLIEAAPQETVEALMLYGQRLDPVQLIPALLRLTTRKEGGKSGQNHLFAIRYLEHCASRLNNTDATLHYLLLTLVIGHGDEGILLRYLTGTGVGPGGKPLYDVSYALRQSARKGFGRACVHLFGVLEMYEDAVRASLALDIELAKGFADKPDDREDRKKLWLLIARHMIEAGSARGSSGGSDIRSAVEFLREARGLLQVEDILPFFPDFVHIDDFKDAICTSLEDYNERIEGLKSEMEEATRGAELLRNDISLLSERNITVQHDVPCSRCGAPIFSGLGDLKRRDLSGAAAVFVFPCGHSFHGECCLMELQENLGKWNPTKKHLQALQRTCLEEGTVAAFEALDDLVGEQCPYCGEMMAKCVDSPLISSEDAAEAEAWNLP